jgi:hypothetical protein
MQHSRDLHPSDVDWLHVSYMAHTLRKGSVTNPFD